MLFLNVYENPISDLLMTLYYITSESWSLSLPMGLADLKKNFFLIGKP